MFVLGLSGSIGMGKSMAARYFRRLGVPVFDADQAVARLMAKGGKAVGKIAALFPTVVRNGAVDHSALAARVFTDDYALKSLESLLHPMVNKQKQAFIKKWRRLKAPLVVLDIPLLYETGGERYCDGVAIVSAPFSVQRRRVLSRPNMSEQRFQAILSRQMPDPEKRRRANFIIPTGLSRAHGFRAVRRIVETIYSGENINMRPVRHVYMTKASPLKSPLSPGNANAKTRVAHSFQHSAWGNVLR